MPNSFKYAVIANPVLTLGVAIPSEIQSLRTVPQHGVAIPSEKTVIANPVLTLGVGSDASAAGGRESELSEWQRSADEEGTPLPTKLPGTATGNPLDRSTGYP